MKSLKKSCRLFLHSSDDCRGKLLLSAAKINQRVDQLKADKVIVECLKCMSDDVGMATMSDSADAAKKFVKPKNSGCLSHDVTDNSWRELTMFQRSHLLQMITEKKNSPRMMRR